MSVDPPVCVALDVPDLSSAIGIVEELSGTISLFKVGIELFCAAGPRAVGEVLARGAQVFLDLKVHDIPRTAAAAVREASSMGASFLTIHGLGGREMVRAAVETSREYGGPHVLVVSVLTSMDEATLEQVGIGGTPRTQALRIGELAAQEEAHGLVLSPWELNVIRSALPHLFLATPGVRPAGSSPDDHRRALDPAEAVLAGADLVVVGRPVLRARSKRNAAAKIVRDVREAARHEARRSRDLDAAIDATDDLDDLEEDDEL